MITLLIILWVCSGPPAVMFDFYHQIGEVTLGIFIFSLMVGAILGPIAWVVALAKGVGIGSIVIFKKK